MGASHPGSEAAITQLQLWLGAHLSPLALHGAMDGTFNANIVNIPWEIARCHRFSEFADGDTDSSTCNSVKLWYVVK